MRPGSAVTAFGALVGHRRSELQGTLAVGMDALGNCKEFQKELVLTCTRRSGLDMLTQW